MRLYGTFGHAHLDGTGKDKFALIEAPSMGEARAIMHERFGPRWCQVYPAADGPDGAGVQEFDLRPCNPHGRPYTAEGDMLYIATFGPGPIDDTVTNATRED